MFKGRDMDGDVGREDGVDAVSNKSKSKDIQISYPCLAILGGHVFWATWHSPQLQMATLSVPLSLSLSLYRHI